MADTKMEANGNIVAFEGHPDVVSTQLRLLPTSPQILILPTVQSYIANDDSERAFEVRSYVRSVHDALTKRHEAARCFLQEATPVNKRLAFLNGGTPSAQALCIKAIMRHETGGDRVEAEAVYAQLARDGLARLEAKSRIDCRIDCRVGSVGDEAMFYEELHDPITRAMRAADALDRETANLQSGDILDLASSTRPRSLSLPLYGYSDGFGDAAPFFLFGAQIEDDEVIEHDPPLAPGAPTFALVDYNQPSKQTLLGPAELPSASPSSAVKPQAQSTLRINHKTEMLSPTTETFNIRTDDHAAHGEAIKPNRSKSVSSFKGSLPRVKSLDRIYPLSAKLRDLCIPETSSEMSTDLSAPCRSHSFMVASDPKPTIIRKLSYIDRRTAASKGRRPTATIDLPLDKKMNARQSTAGLLHTHLETDIAISADIPFQPILPWVEDLLIYFKDETPSVLLSLTIKAFKAGNYPVLSGSTPTLSNAIPTLTASLYQPTAIDRSKINRSHETSVLSMTDDDHDPFADTQPHQLLGKDQVSPVVNVNRPPTPAQTPPPCKAKENIIYEFEVVSGQTAVTIQNSLRSILSEYFPPEAEGYRQFQFSLLPEFDGLWKPIFRESEPKASSRESSRRVDHILAIGSQQGVDKVYSSKIIKQLETIGTKSSDRQGRSGRVDFR